MKSTKLFPIKKSLQVWSSGALYDGVDGYAETVVSLAYASETIQCWRDVNNHWVRFDTASTYTSSL